MYLAVAARDDLLELRTRRRVHEAVAAYPGLHLRELARHAGLDVKHAEYHLRVLRRHGQVSSLEEDGYLRHYPRTEGASGLRDVLDADEKRVLALLRQPVPLHVVLVLLQDGETTFGDLRDRCGVAHGTLHYHLGRLGKQGVVESRKEGRSRVVSLRDADRLHGLLMRYRPPDALVAGFLEAWEAVEL